MTTLTTKFTSTALRMLDRAVSDARNGADLLDSCNPARFRGGMKAAVALVGAGLASMAQDDLGDVRMVVTAAGVEYHTANAAAVDSATDPLNIKGATVHY